MRKKAEAKKKAAEEKKAAEAAPKKVLPPIESPVIEEVEAVETIPVGNSRHVDSFMTDDSMSELSRIEEPKQNANAEQAKPMRMHTILEDEDESRATTVLPSDALV